MSQLWPTELHPYLTTEKKDGDGSEWTSKAIHISLLLNKSTSIISDWLQVWKWDINKLPLN